MLCCSGAPVNTQLRAVPISNIKEDPEIPLTAPRFLDFCLSVAMSKDAIKLMNLIKSP